MWKRISIFQLIGLNLLLILAYVLLGRLTFSVSVEFGNVTSVLFAPEGVALGFFILWGPLMAPGVLIGQALLSYWSGPSLLGGLIIGVINAGEGILGGYLFHRWGLSRNFDRPRDVMLFAVMVFGILQPISATFGVTTLYLVSQIPPDIYAALGEGWWIRGIQKPLPTLEIMPKAWFHWWIGNSLGQLIFAPLLLAWVCPMKRRPLRFEDLLLLMTSLVVVAYILLNSSSHLGPVILMMLSYPLLVWIGLRYSLRVVTLSMVVLAALIIVMGTSGYGFMQHLNIPERLFYASVVIASGALSLLALYAMRSEHNALLQQLQALATTDSLTQLSNRHSFMQESSVALAQAKRHTYPISLVVLDVDHFKDINDQYGHAAGDEALRTLARCCNESRRVGDLVGRIGGEEFALLLPHTDGPGAQAIVDRLRRLIQAQQIESAEGTAISITFSAGVAEAKSEESMEQLMHRADTALYVAKQKGRNQVLLAKT